MSTYNTAVTRTVKRHMQSLSISQKALANDLAMSQTALSQRMRGAARWQLDDLEAIARLFGVPVTYLVSDNAPFVPPTGLEPATSGLVCIPGFADSDPECILRIAA